MNANTGKALKGRSLLKIDDLSEKEIIYLLDLADHLKERKKRQVYGNSLQHKNIALIFEKPSTRTRSAGMIAAFDEGAGAEYMDANDLHLGKKESVKDSARVLGRMYDGILFRGFKQETAEVLAKHAGIPVWNGLTDDEHPTQTLADLMTAREYFHGLKGLKFVYLGDGRNNVCLSLMMGCAQMGMDFVDCTPPELVPAAQIITKAREIAAKRGCSLEISHDPKTAVKGAHVIYTDVWVSMGEEKKAADRLKLLRPYQVNMELMRATGRLKNDGVIFLHCLPAFHNNDTSVTAQCGALEVTDDVFEAPFSKVFEQAENRLHTIKAVMVATLTGGGQ